MSDAAEVARLSVELHERNSHGALEERLAGLMGTFDELCAQLAEAREAIASHMAAYHAEEPGPEPEPAPEPEPEAAPDVPVLPETDPEPEQPPRPEGWLFRRVGGRRED